MLKEKIMKMDIEFLASGGHKIGVDKFIELWKSGKAIMLDVRFKEEVNLCSFNFGINIPLDQLPQNLDKIPKDKLVATFCPEKIRATLAYAYLISEGFENVKILATSAADLADKIRPGLIRKLKESDR
ncbi:Rhodanese-like protein [Desulfurobacterium thermolithotrophum DSM 11699]|uniref:Rhodanese-like protein n=1 Tax=Desulfurobacterium thermolithotrophum (strain DSM 11699 / BSA) TaxID=868864 RepID=F0S2A0_DESTD|nr:rhodanese-like domain-containing protein [Desulfurobacterium thermolithotrophum]ADY74115.1 Rhodanese-like protein [Desulfurobacterium thermolithotrophum DSM 11699]